MNAFAVSVLGWLAFGRHRTPMRSFDPAPLLMPSAADMLHALGQEHGQQQQQPQWQQQQQHQQQQQQLPTSEGTQPAEDRGMPFAADDIRTTLVTWVNAHMDANGLLPAENAAWSAFAADVHEKTTRIRRMPLNDQLVVKKQLLKHALEVSTYLEGALSKQQDSTSVNVLSNDAMMQLLARINAWINEEPDSWQDLLDFVDVFVEGGQPGALEYRSIRTVLSRRIIDGYRSDAKLVERDNYAQQPAPLSSPMPAASNHVDAALLRSIRPPPAAAAAAAAGPSRKPAKAPPTKARKSIPPSAPKK